MEINEVEFSCNVKNLTQLKVKKEWLESALEKYYLEEILIYLAKKIFTSEDRFFQYERQKIVAYINLVKDIKKYTKEDEYKLNLLVRNLKAFQEQEKSDMRLLSKKRLQAINTLIMMAFNMAFHFMLKRIYSMPLATKEEIN